MERLTEALAVLDKNPPDFRQNPERQEAFTRIGSYLEENIRPERAHDLNQNPNRVWESVADRLVRATRDMQEADLESEDVVAWQMYNDGVLIKSGEVVIALDVIPHLRTRGWAEPDEITAELAGRIDLLLVTHEHPDHYDKPLIRACLNTGKPVFLPHTLGSDWEKDQNLHLVADGDQLTVDDLQIAVRQGFHHWRENIDDTPVFYYEITLQQGYRLMFCGDLDMTRQFESHEPVDLLFAPWVNPYPDKAPAVFDQYEATRNLVTEGVNRTQAKALIFQHYGELDHIYDGLPAGYDVAVKLKSEMTIPTELLFWGEKVRLR